MKTDLIFMTRRPPPSSHLCLSYHLIMRNIVSVATVLSSLTGATLAFLQPSTTTNPIIAISNRHGATSSSSTSLLAVSNRRQLLIDSSLITAASLIVTIINPLEVNAAAAVQDSLEIDNFLRTGVDGKFLVYIYYVHILCSIISTHIICFKAVVTWEYQVRQVNHVHRPV